MQTTRVVLLTNRSLLGEGVRRLLQDVKGLELVVVAGDDSDVKVKIRHVAPHVIILDSGDASLGDGAITRMLSAYPRAKVIALDLHHTDIEVYRLQRFQQASLNRLLEAIRGKETSGRTGRLLKTLHDIPVPQGGEP